MNRRGAAAIGLAFALAALGQPLVLADAPSGSVHRVGYLGLGPRDGPPPQECPAPGKGSREWLAILEGLRDRGYAVGENLAIACRYTGGREERAPALAADLVGLGVEVLLANTTPNVRAAKQATSEIPIVMLGVIDPAGRGLVATLERPGANVTGVADDAGKDVVRAYLHMLREVVPGITRVAVLGYAMDPPETVWKREIDAGAREFRISMLHYEFREADSLEGVFDAIVRARAEALVVISHPFAWTCASRIVELAHQHRLPALYPGREFVDAGGLMAYAVDLIAVRRRAGDYAGRILGGAKPSDLTVGRPSRFELVLNLRTASELGLVFPDWMLDRADEAIR